MKKMNTIGKIATFGFSVIAAIALASYITKKYPSDHPIWNVVGAILLLMIGFAISVVAIAFGIAVISAIITIITGKDFNLM